MSGTVKAISMVLKRLTVSQVIDVAYCGIVMTRGIFSLFQFLFCQNMCYGAYKVLLSLKLHAVAKLQISGPPARKSSGPPSPPPSDEPLP